MEGINEIETELTAKSDSVIFCTGTDIELD